MSGPAAKSARARRTRPAAVVPSSGRRALRVVLLAALAFALGWFTNIVRPEPLRPSADAAVAGVPAVSVRIASFGGPFARAGGGVEVAPVDGNADTLLILYGGGLVRPHAYTWLGAALAPIGVRTLIPAMPLDLAVLGRDRAGALVEAHRDGERRVVVAGHSLGGSMAADWSARNPGAADALVLMAAYPPGGTDLSGRADLPTLVLRAENDGVVSRSELEAGLSRLPARTGVEVIDGAVHAFFGRYGTQRGDGLPMIPRERAEGEIAGALEAFVVGLR